MNTDILNLIGVTRPGMTTHISIGTRGNLRGWITCGLVNIRSYSGDAYCLSARARMGITDFEHDSAYIFKIPLLVVNFEFAEAGRLFFNGVIGGDNPEDLRLPTSSNYDPTKLKGAHECEWDECKGENAHFVVPERYWAGPPANPKIWKEVVGKRIEITMVIGAGLDE